MADVSRFFRRASPSPTRGSYESPNLIIDAEGHIFLRGSSNIGVGTRGIGERAAAAAAAANSGGDQGSAFDSSSASPNANNNNSKGTRAQTSPSGSQLNNINSSTGGGSPLNYQVQQQKFKEQQIREYIGDRTRLHKEWRDKEQQRIQSQLAEQANSRQHMHLAMLQHREEILKMGRERKAQEDSAKEERAKEARERNVIIRASNERAIQERIDAKRQREVQKVYDAEALRKKRAELKEIDDAEREVLAQESRQRIAQLQQLARAERKRMHESKKRRQVDLNDSVQSLRREQSSRVEQRDHTMQEIVHLKAELIGEIKTKITSEQQRIAYERLEQAHYNAVKTREEEKKLEAERRRKQEQRIQDAKDAAAARKEEAEIRLNAYLEARDKAKSLLQLQAKEQKQRSRRAIEQEATERHRQTQDYIHACRSLVERRTTSDSLRYDDSKHRAPDRKKLAQEKADAEREAAEKSAAQNSNSNQLW